MPLLQGEGSLELDKMKVGEGGSDVREREGRTEFGVDAVLWRGGG